MCSSPAQMSPHLEHHFELGNQSLMHRRSVWEKNDVKERVPFRQGKLLLAGKGVAPFHLKRNAHAFIHRHIPGRDGIIIKQVCGQESALRFVLPCDPDPRNLSIPGLVKPQTPNNKANSLISTMSGTPVLVRIVSSHNQMIKSGIRLPGKAKGLGKFG
ncbi:uncharacterized protein LY89DRAFT_673142 [Mollisia scopiformis]|uniref:Uncharacterized protein n=1 Tax=Mollisia scopiformis TaxID=149040 RepID=A0A194WYK9_MOLSC|nr:uncharacterized protein LY89DRAFT_673142 [Mollisia scopiformis]KUJ13043.1 hypothetical protein LY89DRAFT_673142 [Mollisia scopiformis]